MRRATVTLMALGLITVGGCAEGAFPWPWGAPSEPPPVVVRDQDSTLRLEPWTTCWSGGGSGFCADGMPPSPLPDLGPHSTEVLLEFPMQGWSFTASWTETGGRTDEGAPAEVVQVDEHTWQLQPPARVGRYQVDVFGQGPQGDVSVSFATTAR